MTDSCSSYLLSYSSSDRVDSTQTLEFSENHPIGNLAVEALSGKSPTRQIYCYADHV